MDDLVIFVGSLAAIVALGGGLRFLVTHVLGDRKPWQGTIDADKFDPFGIACILDGGKGVARLISFSLYLRGYLRANKNVVGKGSKQKILNTLRQQEPLPSTQALSPPEKEALEFFKAERTAKAIHKTLPNRLRPHLRKLGNDLTGQGLMPSAAARNIIKFVFGLNVLAIIIMTLLYMVKEKFSALLALIIAAGAGYLLYKLMKLPNQTAKGKSFIQATRQALQPLQDKKHSLGESDLNFEKLVGVYGFGVLLDTAHQDFLAVFPKTKQRGDDPGGCGGCG